MSTPTDTTPAITETTALRTAAPSAVDDPLMTIDQAAEYLAIPARTLYGWRTRRPGFGPRGIKAGGLLRFRRSDLNAWIERHAEDVDPAPKESAGLSVVQEASVAETGRGRGEAAAVNQTPSITRKSRPRRR